MNNILTNSIVDPNLDQPFLGTSLNFLQNATSEAIKNVVIGLIGSSYSTSQVYILYGCVRTGQADNSGSSGTASVSAGAIFFNGEVYTVPSFTVTLGGTQYLQSALSTSFATFDPVTFSDNITQISVHSIRQWVVSAASSAGSTPVSSWINYNGSWNAATLLNSWANAGAGGAPARYKRNGRKVELGGYIGSGSSGTIAFTLPSGYHPIYEYVFEVASSSLAIAAQCQVDTSGNVTIFFASGTPGINLDGLNFPLD